MSVPWEPVNGAEPSHRAAQTENKLLLARAQAIHRRILTLDTHVDIAGKQYATDALDPGLDHPKLQCDLVKMAEGGVDAVFLIVYVAQGRRDADGYAKAMAAAMEKFEAIHRLTRRYPDRCALANSVQQLQRIVRSGKRAIALA